MVNLPEVTTEVEYEWRLVRVPTTTPKDQAMWLETNHEAVINCMGSIPECAQNGCQYRKLLAGNIALVKEINLLRGLSLLK